MVTDMPKQRQLTLLVIVLTTIQELDVEVSSFFSQNVTLENLGLLFQELPVNNMKHSSLCPQ